MEYNNIYNEMKRQKALRKESGSDAALEERRERLRELFEKSRAQKSAQSNAMTAGAAAPKTDASAQVQRTIGEPQPARAKEYTGSDYSPPGYIRGTYVTPNGADIVYYDENFPEYTGLQNVRDTLASDAYGLDRSLSGFDYGSGNITLNGMNTGLKAADYANGIDNAGRRALTEAYNRAAHNQSAAAREYFEKEGLGGLVSWSDGKVLFGGKELPYQYIDENNHAWVKAGDLQKAVEDFKNENKITNEAELADSVLGRYKSAAASALDSAVNRAKWSYDPNHDPAYEAYARMYSQNAKQLYNRAIGSGGLYGRPTSYQNYQALAAYGDNMQRLSGEIPELERQSYERYSDEQARNLAAYNALRQERADEYAMRSGANERLIDRISAGADKAHERRMELLYDAPVKREAAYQAAYQTEIDKNNADISADEAARSEVYTGMYPEYAAAQLKNLNLENSGAELENEGEIYRTNLAHLEWIISVAAERGHFTDEEAKFLGLSRNKDGEYPKPWDAKIAAELAYWSQVTKPTLMEKAWLGIR